MTITDQTITDRTTTTAPARPPARDARHRPLTRVDRLRQDAAQAAQVRAWTSHPDVIALRVERIRAQVDALMWVGIVLGLAFTMVNVQQFAAAGAARWSLGWCAAWLLDPMVSLVLIAVLRAEQITARYQVNMRTTGTGPWVKRTKVFAFAATYTMNTWASWAALSASGIVLHSVPPLLVYCAAEAGPILRDRLTEAVHRAAQAATVNTAPGVQQPAAAAVVNGALNPAMNGSWPTLDPTATPDAEPASNPARRRSRPATGRGGKRPVRRKLLADYVAEARAAYTPVW
jgi:hypothetical protein